jgi:uncharacterized protein (TIGR02246 family)
MTDDEWAIRELVETWMAATRSGDLETVLGLMTDDMLFMVPGKEPFGKTEFADGFRQVAGRGFVGRSEIVELRLLGDWAFIRNHLEIRATGGDGKEVSRTGYTLSLLRKEQDGRWRLARDANLLGPAC